MTDKVLSGYKTSLSKMFPTEEAESRSAGVYRIMDMNGWYGVGADLILTDPPFGIDFNGRKGNYNRDDSLVVDGYREWNKEEYEENVASLLEVIERNLSPAGQALLFSGWNNSGAVSRAIERHGGLRLNGKIYWVYNFAPACRKRPAHNVYEIFWLVKGHRYTYNRRCSTEHCLSGEANLSSFIFKRDYKRAMPKYPTRLPFELVKALIEHFSSPGDLVFDPLAGSGMVGIVAGVTGRRYLLGDVNPNALAVYRSLIEYYRGHYMYNP